MIFRHSLRSRPAPWLRVLAVVCAGLVFTLSSAAWSPALHAWLHGHTETNGLARGHDHAACAHTPAKSQAPSSSQNPGPDSAEAPHDCAVTHFAGGQLLAIPIIAIAPPETHPLPSDTTARDFLIPSPPRHLQPLAQAPPESY